MLDVMLYSLMPKYRHLLIFAVVVTLLLSGLYIVTRSKGQNTKALEEDIIRTSVVERVQFGYACEKDRNAFELLDEQAEIEFSDSSLGKLVTSINGETQRDNKYWLYSIDGQEATVGASNYTCYGEEQILWELK